MLCSDHGLTAVHVACIRFIWRAILPASILLILGTTRLIPSPPSHSKLIRRLKRSLNPFLTLADAKTLLKSSDPTIQNGHTSIPKQQGPMRRRKELLRLTVPISSLALLETIAWMGLTAYYFSVDEMAFGLVSMVVAVSWGYMFIRPLIRPTATPPYDIVVLLLVQLASGVLGLFGHVYDRFTSHKSWPSGWVFTGEVLDLVIITSLLVVIIRTPVEALGEEEIDPLSSPEDQATIWGWMTFGFVNPLIEKGSKATLNEKDVFELSPHHRASPLLQRFEMVKGKTLLRKIWTINALDLLMDGLLTLVAVVFNYAGPFFLKRILDAISDPTPKAIARAYVYAFLSLLSSLFKSQADMQHLWYGRQAVTRTRSILMSAVFDKAMKRKDFSGVTSTAGRGGKQGGKFKQISIKKAALESMGKGKGKGNDKGMAAGADIGKIVNLMSGDASKVSQILGQLYNLYGAPFEIIVGTFFLYQLLGWSTFVGFIALLSVAPLNHYLSKRRIFISRGISAARDRRMAVVNELFVSVKFIKLSAWDERWIQRSEKARAKEIKWIMRERWNNIWLAFVWTCAPILVSVFSFLAFVVQGNELTVSIAFTSIVLFNLLRQPLNVLPNFLAQFLQARVSLDRISIFFAEQEVDEAVSTLKRNETPTAIFDATLGIVGNAHFVWNTIETPNARRTPDTTRLPEGDPGRASPDGSQDSADEPRFELRDVNIVFPEGQLTLVTGPTASGKTALLLAQLGEMTMVEGAGTSSEQPRILLPKHLLGPTDQCGLRASISYAAQSPWLEHLSIRDNILFGEPFESQRYQEVIECCALQLDLDMLEDGDATEIGERGISLSGGQKARVALARAVYARSKIVLLDDPLSAVDSHTARFLYDKLLRGALLRNRTVVLVTHHVELVLPGAYYYVQMYDGRIQVQGTVQELRQKGVLEDERPELIAEEPEEDDNPEELEVVKSGAQDVPKRANKPPRKLVQEEMRQTGGVQWVIYDTYLRASGYFTWVIILVLIGVVQLFGFFEKLWIKIWGEAYGIPELSFHQLLTPLSTPILGSYWDQPAQSPLLCFDPNRRGAEALILPSPDNHPLFYVAVYAAIGFGGVIITTFNTIIQYHGAIRASKSLFTRLLTQLVHGTMRWHDVTPTGRILNRLSRDMEVLDSSLSNSLRAVIFRLATFLASIVTVTYVFPVFLFPATVISYIYYRISKGYINAGRDMRRMQSTTRSPIFAAFAETLEGIVTVRAFSAERRFLAILLRRIDLTTKMWYGWWTMNRWLLLRFDALGAVSIFIITIFALSGYISSGWAGITITSAVQFTVSVYWTCRLATQLELDLNSVERVVEYLDIPQEPPALIEGRAVPAYWPSTTSQSIVARNRISLNEEPIPSQDFIQVKDLVVRYDPELPPVLHGVSFTLKAGEKVGLLGRTGSGKSTLAMSLLRFVDPSSGSVVIDGIDITSIGLRDLRSRVTIIPQDSVLFSGTLRENLDPFEEHTDSECLDALARVHLLTPGARVRAPTNAHANNSSKPPRATIAVMDLPLTPEPETLPIEHHFETRQPHDAPPETLLAPNFIRGHGVNASSRASIDSTYDSVPPRQRPTEDAVTFRFGGGVESGAASPTGVASPTQHAFGPLPFTSQRYASGYDGADTTNNVSPAPEAQSRAEGDTGGGNETPETAPLTLDTRVASGGVNFSNGQRQLVSMARALLRRNAVVILDEATSSIDFETDRKIQLTIREQFESSCLLTIAHRIRTVIDYDRLIVLDNGRIVEFDTPWKLIQKEGGLFRDMCAKSGQMLELESMAKAKFIPHTST